ncbi:M20/M25/M40 family metallo-hydrolase [Hutsoniella sourekii]|uniref:M20/M25/M40 family metallo-hydrolase n=1 Tax=Hutsoniella sourekii TaxID=87650 RepID=UPI000485927E|nr:M20/M25/M40 family metallo-hydrolase [Hutsoniella sourekii]
MDSNQGQINDWYRENLDWIVSGLQKLLQFPTIYDDTSIQDQAPYGMAIHDCLRWLETFAKQRGLATQWGDGYYLTVSLPANAKTNSKKRIDGVGHIDVVSVDNQWHYPPFGAQIDQGKIYARGSQDMKTQVWLMLVSLIFIKDLPVSRFNDLQVVIGTDEERTMQDMVYYVEQEGLPDFMFTPDSSFPICLGEFGDATFTVKGCYHSSMIEFMSTSNSENIVCDHVEIGLTPEGYQRVKSIMPDLDHHFQLKDHLLIVSGKAAHSSKVDLGDNALTRSFAFLTNHLDQTWAEPYYQALADPHGTGLGLEPYYSPMGAVCLNPSQIQLSADYFELVIDIRYPDPLTREELQERLESHLQPENISCHFDMPVTQVSLENDYVQALLEVCQRNLPNLKRQPFYSAGLTYCKVFQERGVAFGTHFDESGMANLAHQRDEYMTLDLISLLGQILTEAYLALATI